MPQIRVCNDTGHRLDTVRVFPPAGGVIDFAAVDAGGCSEYREMIGARRIAHIEVSGTAGDLVLRPYDYVGEDPLPDGRYSYRLGLAGQRLTIDVTADDRAGES